MKSFIRAITIIIVLALIPAVSAAAQNSAGTVREPEASVVDVVDSASTSRTNDAIVQLRTLLSRANQQSGGGKVLVIPTTQIKPKDMVTLVEDMTVMCRIFEKKLAQSNLKPTLSFYGVTLPGRISIGRDSLESMYIQGYGALFMTTVNFPLSPPPQTEEQEKTEDENADPLWEQVKQEIFLLEEVVKHTPNRQEVQYDARKVENLKSTLIESLVHAANIRGIKTEEFVILAVTGSGISSNFVKVTAIPGRNQVMVTYKDKDKNITKLLDSPSLSDLGISSPTVLTIRAKKSYIDALAQNKIDFDEFKEKVQLISYPCLGQNIGGRSSSFWPAGTTGTWLPETSTTEDMYGGRNSDRRRSRSRGTDAMEGSGIDSMEQSSSNRRRR